MVALRCTARAGKPPRPSALKRVASDETRPSTRVTFTDPQVAAVGMSEEDARAAGIRPKVTSVPVKYLPRAVVSHRLQGVIKIVADAESHQLLGVHMVAPNAGDVIGEAVIAISFETLR